MSKTKAFWLTFLMSILLFLVTCWSAAFTDTTPYWVESMGYFILTYLCIDGFGKKIPQLSTWTIWCGVLLGILVVQIPIRVIDFWGSMGSIMIEVGCIISSILAVICHSDRKPFSFILSYVIISLFNSFVAEMWNNYAMNFLR